MSHGAARGGKMFIKYLVCIGPVWKSVNTAIYKADQNKKIHKQDYFKCQERKQQANVIVIWLDGRRGEV